MALRYKAFRDDLLIALLYSAERKPNDFVDPLETANHAGLKFGSGMVRTAVRDLEAKGLVTASYSVGGGPDSGIRVFPTGAGWELVEQLEGATQQADGAPASDRVVPLDHNAAPYKEAVSALDTTIEAARGANAVGDPAEHAQHLAELNAGRKLLEAARVSIEAVVVVLIRSLKWLALTFAGVLVGNYAEAALTALRALLGL